MAGYSQTPLAKKLGLKENYRIRIINAPSNYFKLFSDLPGGIKEVNNSTRKKNFIHYFIADESKFPKDLNNLIKEMEQDGMIWISWKKKTAKAAPGIGENQIREVGLKAGLVDVKVCAVDETWSALKFVIPVKDRK